MAISGTQWQSVAISGPTLGAARDVARHSTTRRCSSVGGQAERSSNGQWARKSSRLTKLTKLSTASRFASRAASTAPASASSKAASVSAERDVADDLSKGAEVVGSNGDSNGESNGDDNGDSNGDSNGDDNGDSNGDSNGASVRPPSLSSRLEGAVVGVGSRGRLVN